MQLPTEIYDLIADYVENAEYPYITDEGFGPENRARRQLARLRLVNRAYCRSASRHLFRHITIRLYGLPSTIMAIPPLVRLMEISKSPPLACHVRQLSLKFEGIFKRAEDRPDLEDFVGMLSPCLARFTNLKELSFGAPRPSPHLSQEEIKSYIDSVVAALRYVPLPNLEGLELHFPLCHDFGLFFPAKPSAVHVPIASILRRLRHLELEVCARTDSRHQRNWHGPILPEHAALPNDTYVSNLYRMLEPAINLTSLSIHSDDILDLDPVHFPSSIKLRSLILAGVSISAHNLLSLIVTQSSETLQFMYLTLVKLNSETWHHVLSEMTNKKLPHLTEFYLESAGYSPTGTSAHLVTAIPPNSDHEPVIETYSRDDLLALGALQRAVNANRVKAGLRPFSRYQYEYQYAENVPPIDRFRESYFGV